MSVCFLVVAFFLRRGGVIAVGFRVLGLLGFGV